MKNEELSAVYCFIYDLFTLVQYVVMEHVLTVEDLCPLSHFPQWARLKTLEGLSWPMGLMFDTPALGLVEEDYSTKLLNIHIIRLHLNLTPVM